MNSPDPSPEEHSQFLHQIETLVDATGVSRREIIIYCKSGLLCPVGGEEENPIFDNEAIYRLRKIEELRGEHGINLAGIRIIFDLMNEIRRLQQENRFHR
jgi:DNA-binding transcriptional MerR regulator